VTSNRAISVITASSFCIVCISTGTVRLIAALSLLGAFVYAIRSVIGLALPFLVLAGLTLAAFGVLSTAGVALVVAIATLAAARRADGPKPWLDPLAIAGVLVFAVASVLAVRYAADSATADADAASSLAVWAYPSGGGLRGGVEQPAGQSAESLRVVVTQAGTIARAWNDIRLAPGQTWEFTLDVSGPVQVTVEHAGTVVARVSGS
jgi:hypothetical protein